MDIELEEIILYPAVAYRTYQKLKDQKSFKQLFKATKKKLRLLGSPLKRANLIHKLVDLEVSELFVDPVVKENVSCGKSCTACCHTQVSVTGDEANLLANEILTGAEVDLDRLQNLATAENDAHSFYLKDYDQRACPFLKDDGLCSVYESRPTVCRTNHVVSDPIACETKGGVELPVRLLNTYRADMIAMAAFINGKENGALAFMVWNTLKRLEKPIPNAVVNKA